MKEAYAKLMLAKEHHFAGLQRKDALERLSTHLVEGGGPGEGARPRINRRKAISGLMRQLEDRRVSAAIQDRHGHV